MKNNTQQIGELIDHRLLLVNRGLITTTVSLYAPQKVYGLVASLTAPDVVLYGTLPLLLHVVATVGLRALLLSLPRDNGFVKHIQL